MCRQFHRVMGEEGPSHTTLYRYAKGKAKRRNALTERYVREAINRVTVELVQKELTEKTPAKILIVDDEPYIREVLSRWLVKEGYHCVTAGDVDAAWKLLTENSFSLILLDIMMPRKSGIGFLHRIREKHLDPAVIMVSALERQKLVTGTLELGAYGYITKPFDQDEILNHVASALQHREEMLLAPDSQ